MPARVRKPTTRSSTPGVTSVSEWKKNSNPLMELPSGMTVKVMLRPNMQIFMKAGIIPNSLMSIIQSAIKSGTAPDVSEMSIDEEKMDDMFRMMDNIVCFVVQEPEIQPTPQDDEPRDEETLYVDELELTDRQFIFQWAVGGTRDLERFRSEQQRGLDGIRGGQDVGSAPVRAPRRKK